MIKDPYVQQVSTLPRVKEFLDKYDAKKTRDTYRSSLVKLNGYLETKYDDSNSNCDTIIDLLHKQKIDVYDLLRGFISYLPTIKEGITANTIGNYVIALRAYLEFFDIDTHRFKRKVKLPKVVNEKEQAIDKNDIYQMLISCHNKRLKAYILLLISSGIRADSEACTLRNCDVKFATDTNELTELHLRGEFTKTKTTRTSFITPEASKFLKEFIASRGETDPEQLLFSVYDTAIPRTLKETKRMSENIYIRLNVEFIKLLEVVGLDKKKETGIINRRRHCITLHSCRRFTSTVLEDIVGKGYHDFILGHNGYMNMYHTQKKDKIIQDYQRCIPYLTVLDRGFLEATGKSIEAKLEAKDKQIGQLIERYANRDDVIRDLSDTVIQMKKELDELRNERRKK